MRMYVYKTLVRSPSRRFSILKSPYYTPHVNGNRELYRKLFPPLPSAVAEHERVKYRNLSRTVYSTRLTRDGFNTSLQQAPKSSDHIRPDDYRVFMALIIF